MAKKNRNKKLINARESRMMLLTLLAGMLIIVAGVGLIRKWYNASLKPVGQSTLPVNFTVRSGESVKQIGADLEKQQLIRSAKAFETFVRANPLDKNLKAGTYVLSQSMSVPTIASKMAKGQVARNYVTILPDKRLDQIETAFLKAGYSQSEVDQAFKPSAYAGHPALISLPPGASLEGYLYPESFQRQAETPAATIVRESLDQMNKHLTTDLQQAFTAQKLNTFQAITLASIVNQETDDPASQPTVAQVFLTRLHQGISLGSDVTAFYASAIAGKPKSVDIESPYNTRLHPGLPPGPIGNVTASALSAVAHPSNTDYLYFIAGDDKKIHFAKTAAEHEQNIKLYCQTSCGH